MSDYKIKLDLREVNKTKSIFEQIVGSIQAAQMSHWKIELNKYARDVATAYGLPSELFETPYINFKHGVKMKRDLIDGN